MFQVVINLMLVGVCVYAYPFPAVEKRNFKEESVSAAGGHYCPQSEGS